MKLIRYIKNEIESIGLLTDKGILDIKTIFPGPNPPKSIIEILNRNLTNEIEKLAANCDIITALDDIKFLAPIPNPGKLLALAGNFGKHIAEASIQRGFKVGLSDAEKNTTVPRPFLKPASTILNPDDQIPWPPYSEQIDYELELAVIIGKSAKCVSPQNGLDFVAGYTIANDVSARSVTFKQDRKDRPWDEFYDWLAGKWADGFCPLGPFLVTADEIPDPQNLKMQLKVNGKIRQNANTSQMIYPIADIVSFLSHLMTLSPGDIILTGTPSGVALATGQYLKSGDLIECSIQNLGTLKNKLGNSPQNFYHPLN